jgi:hypothetical protein
MKNLCVKPFCVLGRFLQRVGPVGTKVPSWIIKSLVNSKLQNTSLKFGELARKPDDSLYCAVICYASAQEQALKRCLWQWPEVSDRPHSGLSCTVRSFEFVLQAGGSSGAGAVNFKFAWYMGESMLACLGRDCSRLQKLAAKPSLVRDFNMLF